MPKALKPKYAVCPCCNTPRHKTEMETSVSLMEKYQRKEFRHFDRIGVPVYDSFINSDFEWVCDPCFKEGKGLLANPHAQNRTGWPNIAYHDTMLQCRTCGADFVFSKEEKKKWYEGLGFWADVQPAHCRQCRKERRKFKEENKELSEILKKDKKEITAQELESVIAIYQNWGKEEKVKYYQAMLRKR